MEHTAVLPEKGIDSDIEAILDQAAIKATRAYQLGFVDGQMQIIDKAMAEIKKEMAGPAEMFYHSLLKIIPKEDILQHRIGTDYTTKVPTTLSVIASKHDDKMRELRHLAGDRTLYMFREHGLDCQFWVMTDSGSLDQLSIDRDFPFVRSDERREQAMATKSQSVKKESGKQGKRPGEPKRLSKTGEWMRAHPDGVIIIHDLKAVLK